ncbi:PH-like domain-containing protein [Prauserella endophytica]|uniref:Transporter n=1 Tax=Prauserella endophytica TaxID=1592324 RepID=A0ABY2RZF2_9PSEU|nr:transporter [Prauserella endophytica]TKG64840.1 transporter [Prauserella endophytica]
MERLLLTLLVIAFFALGVYGMWRGWRRQARAQSVRVPPFPEVPEDLGEPLLSAKGLYVATTNAGHWQERVVTRGVGLRGPAVLRLYDEGVEVDRAGTVSFWIPRESIVDVKTAKGMAGKVMGTDSLLVFTWRADDVELDTGFRGDDLAVYPQWINQVKGGAQV